MNNYDDDDDEFLYGSSSQAASQPQAVPQSTIPEKSAEPPGPIVAHLEAQAASASASVSATPPVDTPQQNGTATPENMVEDDDNDDEEEEEVDLGSDSDDDDIEIIMEPQSRSLDFRQNRPGARTATAPFTAAPKAPAPQSTLTTEYTPIARGTDLAPPSSQPPTTSQTSQGPPAQRPQTGEPTPAEEDDGIDTSTLPPVTAPPSHPAIDPTAVGVLDGRSILEVDLSAMGEKPWRRPGSDIGDWFNYGFDEISWEAYCYRRRDLGEMADVLKTNVINFSGMPEDQLNNLPPEARQMVMTGTTAMMNNAGNNTMMAPGVMMDVSNMNMMGPMGNGMGMGMGMGGEMGMPGAMMQLHDGTQGGVVGVNTGGEQGMMQDGYAGAQGQQGMMGMGMGGDFGMQENPQMNQQMYQSMENPTPSAPTPVGGAAQRGQAPAAYRGRGAQGMIRGGRGRGRGGYVSQGGPPVPVRPASPLPPNVPTGPRNQNKYKDRDGNAPAVDGLDYGGTNKDFGRTPSGEPEERSSSRKRRSSPGIDEGRGSKRR